MTESKRFQLNESDGKKILVGAGVALGGALLTYVTALIPNVDFGVWTPAVVALASILVNAGRKLLEGKQ